MNVFSRFFKKQSESISKKIEGVDKDSEKQNQSKEKISEQTESNRWYRSRLPKVQQDLIRIFGENAFDWNHIVSVDLAQHVRRTGHVQMTMWSSNGDAHAAGAIKVSSSQEPELITYLKSDQPRVGFSFKCFNYEEYPVLYFIFGISISDKESAILHSVADFSDGDLQEFALSAFKTQFFIIHLFDDSYQHIKDFKIPLSEEVSKQLIDMFDSANSFYKTIPVNIADFTKAGDRFNEEYPEDFWP